MLDDSHQYHELLSPRSPRSDEPTLQAAGSSSLTLRWRVPADTKPEDVEAEYRPSRWLLASAWKRQPLCEVNDVCFPPSRMNSKPSSETALTEPASSREVATRAVHITLRGLDAASFYDVRLALSSAGRRSSPQRFQTLAVAPPLTDAPRLQCARYDRLLLKWASPTTQQDEVLGYVVRYYDTEPRWPVKNEKEVKLASRLLKPSEQTAQFLEGSAAMSVAKTDGEMGGSPEPAQRSGDDGEKEVHYWLTGLSASRMYLVQVAAKTACGQGEWSPKSVPLFTWRKAPQVAMPQLLAGSHASLVFGLTFQSPEDPTKGQDEEVERFELTLQPLQRGAETRHLEITCAAAAQLAAEVKPRLSSMLGLSEEAFPSHVVVASQLQDRSAYSCTAMAITPAGNGQSSQALRAETLPVPPPITGLCVETVDHRSATISWRISPSADLERTELCLGEDAEEERGQRRLRGFRVRLSYEPELRTTGGGIRAQPAWTESIGVRASAAERLGTEPGLLRYRLRDLKSCSTCLVQVMAVAHGEGDGDWSEAVQICTEALAPEVRGTPVNEQILRQSASLKWVTPKEIQGAPVCGYKVHLTKTRERGRGATREFELPLQGASSTLAAASSPSASVPVAEAPEKLGRIWKEESDGLITRMELRDLVPGTSYAVQVAALTVRGEGERSESVTLKTRPVAPTMGAIRARVVHAYHDHLILECAGAVPDWSRGEASDVKGYSARYYECARSYGAYNGAWVYVELVELLEECASTELLRFALRGLSPERQYVVEVAALTAAGRGPWSEPSEKLATWRVAPRLAPPQALLRTHDTLVLGWDREEPDPETLSGEVHDEEITEFLVKVAPAFGNRTAQARTHRVQLQKACSFAETWAAVKDENSSFSATPFFFCEGAAGRYQFVSVVPGLLPDQRYCCQVASVASSGQGDWSHISVEVIMLPVAPLVDLAQVDEVQHDQIQISWEHVQLKTGIAAGLCDRLCLTKSLEDLHVCAYAVRAAAWTTWRGPQWRKPETVEVETLPVAEGGRLQFAIKDLEPEKLYVVEIRAQGASGWGEWSRVGENPVCTAVVAQEPTAPELVYATSRALTFAFPGVEDSRIIAYEVRRHEGWRGRPTRPLRFDSQSLAVRVTSENRWVVTVDQLQRGTTYTLQTRGITSGGGVTKWSEKSEPMATLADEDTGHEVEVSVGVNDDTPGMGPLQLATAMPVADVNSAESMEDFSKKLESVLAFTIDQATAGVRLPSVRIPSVAEQAEELLHAHHGDCRAAVLEAAKIEDDDTWRTKLPDFLIQQVPVVGCSTVLLRELWRSIRRCALVAHLYGHDTRSPETQALILTCLVPGGSGTPAAPAVPAAGTGSASSQQGYVVKDQSAVLNPGVLGGAEDVVSSRRVALLVSRALAKETFVRATGLKSAGQVVGLLEVAGRLLKNSSKDAASEGAALTEQLADDALVAEAATPVKVALVVFRPMALEERPIVVGGLLALWLLPIFMSAARFVFAKVYPLLAQRLEIPLAVIVIAALVLQVLGVLGVVWVQQNLDNFLSIPATLVFVLYVLIPGISICLATRSILQGANEAYFFCLLGVFNLASGFLRWAGDQADDAALDGQAPPRFAACREQVMRYRQWLWMGLCIDFVLEEIMGRVCGLHSLRLLGPALSSTGATLVEYRTLAFAAGLVAAAAQARVLELLQRRSVLLRLLGARKAFIGGITLLLMGAFAVVQQPRTMTFLREVSPTPWWCCMILWLRQYGALVGGLIPLVFYVLQQPQSFGRLPMDSLVPLSVAVGGVLGHLFCQSFTILWQEKREHLESDYRVIFLFPHMSSQARSKASVAMRVALKRGAEATKNTAAEWVAARAVRTSMDFFLRALTRRTALPVD